MKRMVFFLALFAGLFFPFFLSRAGAEDSDSAEGRTHEPQRSELRRGGHGGILLRAIHPGESNSLKRQETGRHQECSRRHRQHPTVRH